MADRSGLLWTWYADRDQRRVSSPERAELARILYPAGSAAGLALSRYAVLAVLSTVIATLGLLLDSVAAVIGAMLIGPFMTPLLGLSLALFNGWPGRLVRSGVVVALGAGLSIGTALAVSQLAAEPASLSSLPTQLLALTHAGLLDLGIALAAGAAAGYGTIRRDGAGALVGVAVSITLEPPLAAIGIFVALGESHSAAQALLTFATNLAAIVLASGLTMAALGMVARAGRGARARARAGLAVTVAVIAAIAVPLALHTRRVVADDRLASDVGVAVRDWDPSVEVVALVAQRRDGLDRVVLTITGPRPPEATWRLAQMLSARRHGRVDLDVRFTLSTETRAVASSG